MDVETKTIKLPLNENLKAELDKLEAEGWRLMPNTQPMAVYEIFRFEPDFGGKFKLEIDETKIHTVRNGKIIQ